jgi:hypothetical protein
MLPNFLVIGSARCGTSWLDQILRQHPEVYLPPKVKEVHFFDNKYRLGIEWYEDFFDKATEPAVGEVTPSYLYYGDAAERIKTHLPDVKMIAVFRNPVERAYSHYWNIAGNHNRRNEPFDMTFEEKIAQNPKLITNGLYAANLEPYLKIFRRDQFLFLLYDDLSNDKQGFLRSIYEFIGVNPNFSSSLSESRVNAAATKLGKSRLSYYFYRACVKCKLTTLASRFERDNYSTIPEMASDTRNMLINDYYASDVKRLESILDRNLSHWIES